MLHIRKRAAVGANRREEKRSPFLPWFKSCHGLMLSLQAPLTSFFLLSSLPFSTSSHRRSPFFPSRTDAGERGGR